MTGNFRFGPTAVRCAALAFGVLFMAGRTSPAASDQPSAAPDGAAIRLVVMDPLAGPLACECVAGYAQRDYTRLGAFLGRRLGRPVKVVHAEALQSSRVGPPDSIDLVVGKFSVVRFDAKKADLRVRSIAMLTGKDGQLTQQGLFVVRDDDPARSIADLAGRRILLGPPESDEKWAAGLAALDAFGILPKERPPVSPSCSSAAVAVIEHEADAAVVSSYAMPLLSGCGTIARGELRVVGRTSPVPFVGLFATDRVDAPLEANLRDALAAVGEQAELLQWLESARGFEPLPEIAGRSGARAWPDWRGAGRAAAGADVPETLPKVKKLLWSHTMTGPGMSGIAVDSGCVIVADKNFQETHDIFRCLDADTGRQLWKLEYPAPGEMDYSNSPRANPVVHDGLVYLLGAMGDLHCVELDSGRIVWGRNLVHEFDAKVPTWGACSAPLVVGDRLIVQPGGKAASLAALDLKTGKTLWTTPGRPPGYSCLIHARLGGVAQVVGYDAVSIGGWDPATGRRLWELIPDVEGDFNVPTPIATAGRLLVDTENNGTRLYGFDDRGRIVPAPIAQNEDLAPDTSTPVVVGELVLGNYGGLVCLDAADRLATLWEAEENPLRDYCSFITGNGRVLVFTQSGKLFLVRADREKFSPIATLELFDDVRATERDVWSHPALVGNRLYIRNLLGAYCFLLQ